MGACVCHRSRRGICQVEQWQERCLILFRSFISGLLVGARGVPALTSLRSTVVILPLELLDLKNREVPAVLCWDFLFCSYVLELGRLSVAILRVWAVAGDAMILYAARALPEQAVRCMDFSCRWEDRLSERDG